MTGDHEANLTHISLHHNYEKYLKMPSWQPFDSVRGHQVVLENTKKHRFSPMQVRLTFFSRTEKRIGGSLKLKL